MAEDAPTHIRRDPHPSDPDTLGRILVLYISAKILNKRKKNIYVDEGMPFCRRSWKLKLQGLSAGEGMLLTLTITHTTPFVVIFLRKTEGDDR
jgi:hypothetical protein